MKTENIKTSSQICNYDQSRYNSLNHGVLSRLKVLPWEDPNELGKIQDSFLENHRPVGATENCFPIVALA